MWRPIDLLRRLEREPIVRRSDREHGNTKLKLKNTENGLLAKQRTSHIGRRWRGVKKGMQNYRMFTRQTRTNRVDCTHARNARLAPTVATKCLFFEERASRHRNGGQRGTEWILSRYRELFMFELYAPSTVTRFVCFRNSTVALRLHRRSEERFIQRPEFY